MNITNLISSQVLSVFIGISALAQGTFQNLDFEQANPISAGVPYEPQFVTAASALPYWTASIGGVQQTDIGYNFFSTGETFVSLIGPGYGPIDGNYSVLLYGGITASAASISQTGLIPAGTQSLFFEAQPTLGSFEIALGSQAIPFMAVGTGPNYTLYGANISAWAGLTEQLTFSALENENSYWIIDDISFSPNPVPEPSPLALTGIGGLLFALYRRFAPKQPPHSP